MSSHSLIVLHIMEGTLAGTDSWFHNPSAQVSAHFGCGKDGSLYQWVDTDITAWAEANYNDRAISIEHEGNSGDSLTPAQIATDRALLEWINANYDIPLVATADPSTPGIIGHGQLGVAGGNHPDCPGQPILDQIPLLIAPSARKGIPVLTPGLTPGELLFCQLQSCAWSYWGRNLNPVSEVPVWTAYYVANGAQQTMMNFYAEKDSPAAQTYPN